VLGPVARTVTSGGGVTPRLPARSIPAKLLLTRSPSAAAGSAALTRARRHDRGIVHRAGAVNAALTGVYDAGASGMGNANPAAMISKKQFNKALKGALAVMPAIPFIARRRSSVVLPLVLGGIGAALAGGIAAVIYFSPRTRYRALDIAKETYGKVNSQITHLKNRASESQPLANGLSGDPGVGTGYSSTGL
jgi:hypothetical protein